RREKMLRKMVFVALIGILATPIVIAHFAEKAQIKAATTKLALLFEKERQEEKRTAEVIASAFTPRIKQLCAEHAKSIQIATSQYPVDPIIVTAVIRIESACDKNVKDGRAGEKGLMQIKPIAAKHIKADPKYLMIPRHNIQTGTKYLWQLKKQFGGMDKALFAWNTGETAARKLLAAGYDPKNNLYVRKVNLAVQNLQKSPG
ncbi:MAG: transglycosylase SLT domain-containing protein, partial [bacterium]|nr:transglycosylase SLT domain-containing protein [bacterium]